MLAYGSELIEDPDDADRFVDNQHLKALETAGSFAGQQVAIAPIKSSSAGPVETDPLLSKNIRFMFEPNSAKLDLTRPENLQNLGAIRRMLQVSPGSSILLRGHVDPSNKQMFMQQGRALAEQRDYIGAYNAFRQAFGYDPVNQLAVSEMERMLRLQEVKVGGAVKPNTTSPDGTGGTRAGLPKPRAKPRPQPPRLKHCGQGNSNAN